MKSSSFAMFFDRCLVTPDSDLCRTPIPKQTIKWFGMKPERGFDILRKGGSAYAGIGVRIGADLALDHKFNTLVSELSRLSTESVSTDDLLRIKQIARATARGDKTALKQWNKEHRA